MLGLAPLLKQALGKLEIDNLRKLALGPLNTSLEVLSPRNVNSLCWFKSALSLCIYYFKTGHLPTAALANVGTRGRSPVPGLGWEEHGALTVLWVL